MQMGDSAWLMVRASGTENVLRLYAEAPSRAQVNDLLGATAKLAQSR
jgi:phosphomannomutase